MQAKNPKDQYLLLKALNEVIVSISSGCTGKRLSLAHQKEVCLRALGLPVCMLSCRTALLLMLACVSSPLHQFLISAPAVADR